MKNIHLVAAALLLSSCAVAPQGQDLVAAESGYTCLRFAPPAWGIQRASAAPAPGNRIAHDAAEWKKLWNYLRYDAADSDPPLALPAGQIAVVMSIYGSTEQHVHLRSVTDDGVSVTFAVQKELREFPMRRDGTRRFIANDTTLESLAVFVPDPAPKPVAFRFLPDLTWIPDNEDDVTAAPPCATVKVK